MRRGRCTSTLRRPRRRQDSPRSPPGKPAFELGRDESVAGSTGVHHAVDGGRGLPDDITNTSSHRDAGSAPERDDRQSRPAVKRVGSEPDRARNITRLAGRPIDDLDAAQVDRQVERRGVVAEEKPTIDGQRADPVREVRKIAGVHVSCTADHLPRGGVRLVRAEDLVRLADESPLATSSSTISVTAVETPSSTGAEATSTPLAASSASTRAPSGSTPTGPT
jgi:hypothetical protein